MSCIIVKKLSSVYVADYSSNLNNYKNLIICLKIFCQKEYCLSEKMSQRHVSLVSIPIGFPLQRQSEILFSTWLEEETLFPGITSQSETPTRPPPPRLGIKRRKKTIRNWNKWLEKLMDRKRKESCPLFYFWDHSFYFKILTWISWNPAKRFGTKKILQLKNVVK